MLRRERWLSLDGEWEFALDADARSATPAAAPWNGGTIRVPYAPETPASGAGGRGRGIEGYFRRCWYRQRIPRPEAGPGQRVLLHFEAVDYEARVWVNGRLAVTHEGGYTPFSADITDLLAEGEQEIVVCADDDPHDLRKPRGKQDWLPEAHSIWYPRTTGIWQSVWMEVVPETFIQDLRWTPSVERGQVEMLARIQSPPLDGLRLAVTLRFGERVLCDDVCSIDPSGEVRRALPVAHPGAEDFAIDLLWSPEHPRLIEADLRLLDAEGQLLDQVASYTALREVAIDGDRFLLNRRPRTLRLVLDQGYWPETGATAPDDAALLRDVELVKELGFDGVRMHQKIESRRFLYWADRLGLFVWEEMPSPYAFDPLTVRRTTAQWAEAIARDASHPCIVAWVPMNESWGAPDLPVSPAQRAFVAAMYHLTRAMDPTRPAIGNDGWEIEFSDITAIHDYDSSPERIASRYRVETEDDLVRMLQRERPGYRRLVLDGYTPHNRPVMLTEFGGIAFSGRADDWGYSRARTAGDFLARYRELLAAVRSVKKFAGFCYTQFTDTYQEANGLLYMDRSPKAKLEELRAAVVG
jgi:beta-galactosidase/beta-glucuronidase